MPCCPNPRQGASKIVVFKTDHCAALVKITCKHVEMFNNNKTGMFSQIIFRPVRPRVVCLLDFLKSY